MNKNNPYPIGTKTARTHLGVSYNYIKIAEGWKQGSRITEYKDRFKRNNAAKGLPPRQKKEHMIGGRNLLTSTKDIKVEAFNPAIHKMVKVDNRTWRQVLKS